MPFISKKAVSVGNLQELALLLTSGPKDFWSIMNRGPLLVSLLCLTGGVAHGEDLLAVYDRALLNDPQIREAEATRMAAMEAKPQALANLLPQFSGTGTRSRAWSDTTGSTTNVLVNNTTQAANRSNLRVNRSNVRIDRGHVRIGARSLRIDGSCGGI